MKMAAIGIGSNSLRMLVADLSDGKLTRLGRYRKGLRVFAALDERGNIQPSMMAEAVESVKAFQQEALSCGVQSVCLFATSAVRDAANQQAFAQALLEETGLMLDVCSGQEEACLSFWGVSEEGKTGGLIDIGGGSTELALGRGREVFDSVSLQMGAVRLFRMQPITNAAQAEQVTQLARDILAPVKERFCGRASCAWTGVGGTFTTSAALVQRIPWEQRDQIHGFSLSEADVREVIAFLAPMPMEERLTLPCLQPQRADIVVHGMAILLACMQELAIPAITVSEYGNLEGYLKAKYLF